jgi:ubiquitin-protein ligase
MPDSPRIRRLRSDHRSLVQLKSESTIFDFIPIGDPPDQYVLRFKGRGVYRTENHNDVLVRHEHEVLLRLGSGYPRSLPSLTWRTPIFHPNIASSGVVCLGAYGQHWAPSVTLEELVGMLWDMIRYANFDVDSPYNREAANWARTIDKLRFPLDARPLRDITAGQASMRPAVPAPHIMTTPRPNIDHLLPAATNPFAPVTSPDIEFLDSDVVDAELVPSQAVRQDDGILFIN